MTGYATTRRRRTVRYPALIAAALVAVTMVGYLVAGARFDSHAATGADITYRLTAEPADARTGYANLLNQIRSRVSTRQVTHPHPTRPDRTHTVDVLDPNATGGFVTIDVHALDNETLFVRLLMRRSDMFVMGWWQGAEDVPGGIPTFGAFFTLEGGFRPPAGVVPAGADPDNVNTDFNRLINYTELERQAGSRVGRTIGVGPLNNAVEVMQSAEGRPTSDVAGAVMTMIMGVAEGARFRDQAAETATAMGNGQDLAITQLHTERQNAWARLSLALVEGLAIAGAIVIGGITIETTVAIAAILLVAHVRKP